MRWPLFLLASCVALAVPARADGSPELDRAKSLISSKKWKEALKVAEEAEARGGTPLEATLTLLECRAIALSMTNKAAGARAAFQRLLALAPDHPAPSVAGKPRQAYEDARRGLDKNPPLAFTAAAAETASGKVKRVAAVVTKDALSLARKVQFSVRTPPETRWDTLLVPLNQGRAEVRIDAASVEWFASLLGERDAELARLASAAAPLVEQAPAAEQPAPAASTQKPAPAAASRAAEAVVFRVSPISVVVLPTQALGGAEQSALVTDDIARALPSSAFKVTTSAQLQAVLGLERQKQLLGCGEESSSCMTELANALGAEVLVNSTLAKTSDGPRCNVSFVSGRDGTSLGQVSVAASSDGALFEKLFAEVSEAAARLFEAQRPGARLEPGKPGVRKYALAPALLAAGLGATSGVMFVLAGDAARALQSRDGQFSSSREVADRAGLGRTTEALGWVFAGTAVAALATASVMFAAGAPTDAKVVLVPLADARGAGLMLSGVIP